MSQASTRANSQNVNKPVFLDTPVHMKPGAHSRHTDVTGCRQDDSTAAPTVDVQHHLLLATVAISLDINCQAEKETRFTKENKSRLVMQMSCKVVTVIWGQQYLLTLKEGVPPPIHPQINVTGSYWWEVNIASGNGLAPSGNNPLPEQRLIQINIATWHD